MKRAAALFFVLVALCSVYAASRFSFGAGFSFTGTSERAVAADAGIFFRPFRLAVMNPCLRAEGGVSFNRSWRLGFSGLKAGVVLELFRTMKNPFSFTLDNPGPWCPALTGGISTDFKGIRGWAELSPFRVLDKDFIYEWFAVSVLFTRSGIDVWQVTLFRFTPLF